MQISKVLAHFLENIPTFKQTLLVGGSTVKEDIAKLENGTNIIVATPGRLEDILTNCKEIDLVRAVKSLVTTLTHSSLNFKNFLFINYIFTGTVGVG